MNGMDLIANLGREDLPSLKKFIARQFHENYILLNDEFFEWQYRLNPYNRFGEYAMKIIKLKGEVLGYNGLVPLSMKVFDRDVEAVAFANLMIREKCRGFGLGTELIKQSSKEFPVCYIPGYNLETENIYRRLGNWTPLGKLRRFVKILDLERAAKLAGTSAGLEEIAEKEAAGFEFAKANGFDEKITAFWEKIKRKYPITVNRSKEYLNWRYSSHPILKYLIYLCMKEGKIAGFAVVRVEEAAEGNEKYRIGRIIDFVAVDSAEEFLLNSVVRAMRAGKADLIDFFFSGNFHIKALKAQGFVECVGEGLEKIPMLFNPIERKRRFINLIAYAGDYKGRKREFTNPKNWYITKGDGDQDRPN